MPVRHPPNNVFVKGIIVVNMYRRNEKCSCIIVQRAGDISAESRNSSKENAEVDYDDGIKAEDVFD